jgi:hypothetical protein
LPWRQRYVRFLVQAPLPRHMCHIRQYPDPSLLLLLLLLLLLRSG